ncbi:hypothetical protein AB0D27_07200 [Streptomyces sp. NPDC048415]|uniref:hypothetical protein n=1 Tax=Streptomyces sp. NPDC048415 TaxID=3154822 RepID=UPI0034121870
MMWDRLTPDGHEALRLAHSEARERGRTPPSPPAHPYPRLADEHVLLGLVRHGTSEAAALLGTQDLGRARQSAMNCGGPAPR